MDGSDLDAVHDEEEVQYFVNREPDEPIEPTTIDLGGLDVVITGVSVITWMAAREKNEEDFGGRIWELDGQIRDLRETTFGSLRELGKRVSVLEKEAEKLRGGK